MKYHCYCGCVYNGNEELAFIRRTENGEKIQRLRCPKHKDSNLGNLKEKSHYCIYCKKTYIISIMANEPNACKVCASKIKMGQIKEWQENKKNAIISSKKNEPKRVFSVDDAKKKAVNCIPLDSLFKRRQPA